MNSRNYYYFILMIMVLTICKSCILEDILDSEGNQTFLVEKEILSDTTIIVGNSLCLNLKDYYYLEGDRHNLVGYPDIDPEIMDTSIAYISNFNLENFTIYAKKVGTTDVSLYLEWWTCDNTITRDVTKTFLLSVVEGVK